MTEDHRSDTAPEASDATEVGLAIDWHRLDLRHRDGQDGSDLPPVGDPGDHRLLEDGEALDPSREGRPVSDLHPDRLTAPTLEQQRGIADAVARDGRVDGWVGAINPDFARDARDGRADHTTNCADCARAVQSTLDGRPTAAAAIHPDGLPLAGSPERGGESVAYTEQWAGRRADTVGYDEIGRRVAADRGSAIVFATGDGGHAFNAVWSPEHGRVRWVDGQSGETGDWPPDHLAARLPRTSALFFPAPRRFP